MAENARKKRLTKRTRTGLAVILFVLVLLCAFATWKNTVQYAGLELRATAYALGVYLVANDGRWPDSLQQLADQGIIKLVAPNKFTVTTAVEVPGIPEFHLDRLEIDANDLRIAWGGPDPDRPGKCLEYVGWFSGCCEEWAASLSERLERLSR